MGGALDWYSPICGRARGEIMSEREAAVTVLLLKELFASVAIKPARVNASNRWQLPLLCDREGS